MKRIETFEELLAFYSFEYDVNSHTIYITGGLPVTRMEQFVISDIINGCKIESKLEQKITSQMTQQAVSDNSNIGRRTIKRGANQNLSENSDRSGGINAISFTRTDTSQINDTQFNKNQLQNNEYSYNPSEPRINTAQITKWKTNIDVSTIDELKEVCDIKEYECSDYGSRRKVVEITGFKIKNIECDKILIPSGLYDTRDDVGKKFPSIIVRLSEFAGDLFSQMRDNAFVNEIKVDLRDWVDMSVVRSMKGMFAYMEYIKEVDLSNLGMSTAMNLEDVSKMFYNCSSLRKVSFSKYRRGSNIGHYLPFNTNVLRIDMSEMFKNCRYLEEVDLTAFDSTNGRVSLYCYGMFDYCRNLRVVKTSRQEIIREVPAGVHIERDDEKNESFW